MKETRNLILMVGISCLITGIFIGKYNPPIIPNKETIDTIPTFEKSKYYKEWKCWKYRADTANYNRDYLSGELEAYQRAFYLGIKAKTPTEYYANENEQIRSEQQMERLKRLFRKDQAPCK